MRSLTIAILVATWLFLPSCMLMNPQTYQQNQRSGLSHYLRSQDRLPDKLYLNPSYTVEGVRTYRLDWICERDNLHNLNPFIKERFCRAVLKSLLEHIHKRFPEWEEEENPDSLRIKVEMEGIWAGLQGKYQIEFVKPVFFITVVRWGTVVLEYRYKREVHYNFFNSDKMTNDEGLMANVDLFAQEMVEFIGHPNPALKFEEDDDLLNVIGF